MDRIDDAYNGLMGEEFMRKTRERLHWMCSRCEGRRILDVGCSQGTLSRLLGPLGKSVLGVDINKDAIAYAEGKLADMDESSRERLSYITANFMDFTTDERFDTVVMGEILEHLAAPELFAKKAYSLLARGGMLVVTVPFGINDDPDHRQTFYWTWIKDFLEPLFCIKEVNFFGKWIGVVGVKREKRAVADKQVPVSFVRELETAFYALERPIVNENRTRAQRLQSQNKDIVEIKKALAAATSEASTAKTDAISQKTRADKAIADCQKIKADLSAEIVKQKDVVAKLTAEKAAVEATSAKQKTVLDGEVARQKTALAAEQAKVKDLNAKLVATRNELVSTKNEALELRVNLDADRKVSSGQAEQISVLKAALQFAANRPQIETNDTRLIEYSQEVHELRSALEGKRDEIAERAEKLGMLSGRIDVLNVEKGVLSSRIAELSAALEAKSSEAAKAEDHARQRETENAQLNREVALLKEQVREAAERTERLGLLSGQVNGLTSQVDALNAENQTLSSKTAELSAALEAKSSEVDKAEGHARQRETENAQLNREVALLKEQVRESAERTERLGLLSGQVNALTSQVDALNAEKQSLSSKTAELSAALEAKISAVRDAEEHAKLCDKENLRLNEAKNDLLLKVEELSAKEKELESSISSLAVKITDKDESISQITSECAELERVNTTLSNEISRLKSEKEFLSTKIADLVALFAAKTYEAENTEDRMRACEIANAKLESQRADIQTQLEWLAAENSKKANVCADLEGQLAVSRQSVKTLQIERDEAARKCVALEKECAETRSVCERLNGSLKSMEVRWKEADTAMQVARSENRTLDEARQKAVDAQKATADSLQKQISELQQSLSAHRREYAALMMSKSAAVRRHDEKASKLKKMSRKYKALANSKLGRLTLAWWQIKDRLKHKMQKKDSIAPTRGAMPSNSTVSVVELEPLNPAASGIQERFKRRFSGKAIRYNDVGDFLKETKVACIMDEFTWKSYSPEANMIQLVPENYLNQLHEFRPELIFVESAWRGVDNKWTNCVHKIPDELKGILQWAHENGVPTAFWNKEDPIHFDTFKNAALLFDFIFTYDFNCVQKYRAITGKANAFFLPMAVQPSMFNPIEKYKRKDAFCFAGSYYRRYVERTKDLDGYIKEFPSYKKVEIYDRQFGKDDPNYMMPPEYAPYIKGILPYDEIDKAYKGYSVSINLNSIKQANSIARRVFELLACNTVTVSNYSYGVVTGFGDLVITSDCADVVLGKLKEYEHNSRDLDKFKLLGLRKVFSENTYRDRFAYICSKIIGVNIGLYEPSVAVVAHVRDEADYLKVQASFDRQRYENKQLLVLSERNDLGKKTFYDIDDLLCNLKGVDYVGVMVPDDYYAEGYLEDMVYAFKYSSTDAVAKGSYFELKKEGVVLQSDVKPYILMNKANLRRGLIKSNVFITTCSQKPKFLLKSSLEVHISTLSIDMFNYCECGVQNNIDESQVIEVSDLTGINEGFKFSDMQNMADTLKPVLQEKSDGLSINSSMLYDCCKKVKCKNVEQTFENGRMALLSTLGDDEHVYFPIDREFSIDDIPLKDGAMHLNQEVGYSSSVLCSIAYFFYDEKKKKIKSSLGATNANLTIDVPQETKIVKFQLRLQKSGLLEVGSLNFSHKPTPLPHFFNTGKILCLTNHYPSYNDIYRNGFVHARMKLYSKNGVNVPVFKITRNTQVQFSEFEGVNVVNGNSEYLSFVLQNNGYSTIVVHFLTDEMWKILKSLPDTTKIIVWCHGADILKYTRRLFCFTTDVALKKAKAQSEMRSKLWAEVFGCNRNSLHFVFVSNWLKNVVADDYGIELRDDKCSVIHNPIDTDMFEYVSKTADDRYRILSIRPYASLVYANDIMVKCVLELSKRNDFQKFHITIIGDGPLFEQTVQPLKNFSNVSILKRFLRQIDIARYHKGNGIFLVPSRQDTQGVSRDEAMSSGLVPITNNVAAIPEFVDNTCGVLSPNEDYKDMAHQIGQIVENPVLFLSMSRAAAERVRRESSLNIIVKQELLLIK